MSEEEVEKQKVVYVPSPDLSYQGLDYERDSYPRAETETQFKNEIITPGHLAAKSWVIRGDKNDGGKLKLFDDFLPIPEIFTKDMNTANLSEEDGKYILRYIKLYSGYRNIFAKYFYAWYDAGMPGQVIDIPLFGVIYKLADIVAAYCSVSKGVGMKAITEAQTQRQHVESYGFSRQSAAAEVKKPGFFSGNAGGQIKPADPNKILGV